MLDKIFECIGKAIDFIWELIGLEDIHDDTTPVNTITEHEVERMRNIDGCWILIEYPTGLRELLWVTEDVITLSGDE